LTRIPQSDIEDMTKSRVLQERLGMIRERGENDYVWAARLATAQLMATRAKEHATYWLGLAQYDLGKFEAAVEWLDRRTLGSAPDGHWAQGARYNLGRSLEALGRLEEARRHYLSNDASPQHHGNLIRARMLAKRISQAKSDASP